MSSQSLLALVHALFLVLGFSAAHGKEATCPTAGYQSFEQAQTDAENFRKQFDRVAAIRASRAAWCLSTQEFSKRDERSFEARLRLSLSLSDLYRFADARQEAQAVEIGQGAESFLEQLKLAALGKADALSLRQGKAEEELETSRKLALALKQKGMRFSIDYAAPLAYIYWLNPPNGNIWGIPADCVESDDHTQASAQEQIVCESERLAPPGNDDAQRLSYDGWLRAYAKAARSDFAGATHELTFLLAKYDTKEVKDYVMAPDNPVRILTLGMLLDNQRRQPVVEAALKDLGQNKITQDFVQLLKASRCSTLLRENRLIENWYTQSDVPNLIVGAMHNPQIRKFLVTHRSLLPKRLDLPVSDFLFEAALQSPPDLSQFIGMALPDKEDSATAAMFGDPNITSCIVEIASAPKTQLFISMPELHSSDLQQFFDTIFQIVRLYVKLHHYGDKIDVAEELIGKYVFGTAVDYAGCSFCSDYVFEGLAASVDRHLATGGDYGPLSQIAFARLASYAALRGNYDRAFAWFRRYGATVQPWADEELQNTVRSRRVYEFQDTRGVLIDYLVQLALKAPAGRSTIAANIAADALLGWRSALEFEQAVADSLNSKPNKPETMRRNLLTHHLAITYSLLLTEEGSLRESQRLHDMKSQQLHEMRCQQLRDMIMEYDEELDESNAWARLNLSKQFLGKVTVGDALRVLSEVEVANKSAGALSELTGLSGRTAYIQFRAYTPLDFDFNKTSEPDRWAALVLRPKQAPRIVSLATVEETRKAIDGVRGRTGQQEGCIGNPDDDAAQTDLFNKLIRPLESALGDADLIYIVAPNELQWVSFEWLRSGGHLWAQTPPKMIRYLAAPTSLMRQTGRTNSLELGKNLQFLTVGAENYGGDQAECTRDVTVRACPKCLQCSTMSAPPTGELFCDASAVTELSRIRANVMTASNTPFYFSPERTDNNQSRTLTIPAGCTKRRSFGAHLNSRILL